jgi:hypothetical protein
MSDSFYKQYKHPNWQKKRLECLELSNFTCQSCGSTDDTLHVHHKKYVRGRMVWEYEHNELEVLCEACHALVHDAKRGIDDLLSMIPQSHLPVVYAVLAGWLNSYVSNGNLDEVYQKDPIAMYAGMMANTLWNVCSIYELMELVNNSSSRDISDFANRLRSKGGVKS